MSAPPRARPAGARLRPKDAATLIVLRRDAGGMRVLMGRRSDAHVFMPGSVVFPGGRVDRADRYAPALDALHPLVAAKLALAARSSDPLRLRAMALAAIREAYEETGILIGKPDRPDRQSKAPGWVPFFAQGIVPTLAPLRLVARAITPPGHNRRFDARFFAVFADAIAAQVAVPDHELHSPAWLSFDEARAHNLAAITRGVLDGLEARLARDPDLQPDGAVPFHYMHRGKHCVEQL